MLYIEPLECFCNIFNKFLLNFVLKCDVRKLFKMFFGFFYCFITVINHDPELKEILLTL